MTEPTDSNQARLRLARLLGVEEPFPWQLALLNRLLAGSIPNAIDVPTGLGKTAVIAIWLVARAAGSPLPRRLVYVVDRRAVVDQATQVAEGLRKAVDDDRVLKEALRLDRSLPISTLRGKFLDNREWLADPAAPAVVLGTVDMVGSRLLFQGYGVSSKMRPYHAGLLGADTLVVLDEAHLTPPFERLIEAVASGQDARACSLRPLIDGLVPSVQLLSLSATGRHHGDTLGLGEADRAHQVVRRRLGAVKRTTVRDEVDPKELAETLANEAWCLSDAGTKARRIIVFCNRRDDATKVADSLRSRSRKANVPVDTELFVGGRRIYERTEAARWLDTRGFLAGRGAPIERPAFVIATSAGEVGVDMDAEHMVSDLVAWERMIQRFGRVNRRGDGDASVVIVPAATEGDRTKDRMAAVRALFEALPRRDGATDASPGAFVDLKRRSATDAALQRLVARGSTPPELHPPLSRATIEAWSMTSLPEHTGRPDVAPWIRGWIEEEEEPQTTVVWRTDLPVFWRDDLPYNDAATLFEGGDLESFREGAEPHMAERLETETWRVVDWLGKRLKNVTRSADEQQPADPSAFLRNGDVAGVILDGRFGARLLKTDAVSNKIKRDEAFRALSGGLLLVDVRLRGLERGLLSDEGQEGPFDLTRLDGEQRAVPFRVRSIDATGADSDPEWRIEAQIATRGNEDHEVAWLVIESVVREAAETEEGRSAGARRAQLLDDHESWAEEEARRIGDRLALPARYTQMLAVAARLHDEGKRAKRWQQAFRAPATGIYAKTTSRPSLKILDHYRHELGSLPHAERSERLQQLDPPLRDLCLHLIAAHHGNARPLLRVDGAEEPPTRLAQRAQEIALRFARLEKEWGPWGLAWWEALLRAADQQASRRNDEEGVRRG